MSKLFKSSRVTLDDRAFVLSSKAELSATPIEENDTVLAAHDVETHIEAANQVIEGAHREAESILIEADQEAKEKLDLANQSSEKIIADAYEKAKEIMESAREQGYQEGFEKAMSDAQTQSDDIINQALYIREEWHNAKAAMEKEVEEEVVGLVLNVVENILNKTLEDDKSYLEDLVASAIKRVNKSEMLVLRVSAEDYNHAIMIKPMILAMTEKIDDIEIKQDTALVNGSCIIDTDSGSIDASIWTQFEQVKSVFEDILRSE